MMPEILSKGAIWQGSVGSCFIQPITFASQHLIDAQKPVKGDQEVARGELMNARERSRPKTNEPRRKCSGYGYKNREGDVSSGERHSMTMAKGQSTDASMEWPEANTWTRQRFLPNDPFALSTS